MLFTSCIVLHAQASRTAKREAMRMVLGLGYHGPRQGAVRVVCGWKAEER